MIRVCKHETLACWSGGSDLGGCVRVSWVESGGVLHYDPRRCRSCHSMIVRCWQGDSEAVWPGALLLRAAEATDAGATMQVCSSRQGSTAPKRSGNMIVQGHASSGCKPLSLSLSPFLSLFIYGSNRGLGRTAPKYGRGFARSSVRVRPRTELGFGPEGRCNRRFPMWRSRTSLFGADPVRRAPAQETALLLLCGAEGGQMFGRAASGLWGFSTDPPCRPHEGPPRELTPSIHPTLSWCGRRSSSVFASRGSGWAAVPTVAIASRDP